MTPWHAHPYGRVSIWGHQLEGQVDRSRDQWGLLSRGQRRHRQHHLLRRMDLSLAGGQAAGLGDGEAVGNQWGSDRGTGGRPGGRFLSWPSLPRPFPYSLPAAQQALPNCFPIASPLTCRGISWPSLIAPGTQWYNTLTMPGAARKPPQGRWQARWGISILSGTGGMSGTKRPGCITSEAGITIRSCRGLLVLISILWEIYSAIA